MHRRTQHNHNKKSYDHLELHLLLRVEYYYLFKKVLLTLDHAMIRVGDSA